MKKYNVGVVGYGWAAAAPIAAIQASALAQVTHVRCSRQLDAAEVSARHGTPIRCYTDYAEMLRDREYEWCTTRADCGSSLLDNKFHSNLIDGLSRHQWNQLSCQPVDSGDVSDHPYQAQLDALFQSIDEHRAMPLTGSKEAVRTHEVIFAAMDSEAQRWPITLDEVSSG